MKGIHMPVRSRLMMVKILFVAIGIVAVVSAPFVEAAGKIYRYKDKDGNWCFTDNPANVPGLVYDETDQQESSTPREAPPSPTRTEASGPHARNPIEAARNATVLVKTARGSGSGFFVTEDGYILTNRHVVDVSEKEIDEITKEFEKRKRTLDELKEKLQSQLNSLTNREKELADLRAKFDRENEPRRRTVVEKSRNGDPGYEGTMKRIESELTRTEEMRRKTRAQIDRTDEEIDQLERERERSIEQRRPLYFSIVRVDGTEVSATIVATGIRSDLALLKINGYRTEPLSIGNPMELAHGSPVYAIGSPLGLKQSVTSGIFSGFQDFSQTSRLGMKGRFIQTNAQINPGNSGGPLIDQNGKVLGVNTWKKVYADKRGEIPTEGIGFAIPIDTAFEEFKTHIEPKQRAH
ncbi:MAG: DUF4124 domain-containing protein [Desulfobacteraceae bacterium]|nr:MAG: DUF4124 domain-containing protein [Desulfobacteraceae bacterium]